MQKTIQLFMWGFQEHFRLRLQLFTKDTLTQIGKMCKSQKEVKEFLAMIGYP